MDKKCSHLKNISCYGEGEEASSIEWEFTNMTEQEEDIICRMHKLVGDKWELIAGRIPGRSAVEIERFWLMRNSKKSKIIEKQLKGDNKKLEHILSIQDVQASSY